MVIFVAGVHGVGKTYLCQRFSKDTGIKHFSASSLIREEVKSPNWGSDKLVSNVDANQIALTTAVKRILASESLLLLDGHFVLKNADGSLAVVHEDTFKNLSLSAILLIEASPETIRNRLSARDSNFSAGNIDAFLASERERSRYISELLCIPLTILHAPSDKEFFDTLNTMH